MSFWNVKDFTTGLAVKIKSFVVNTDENIPTHGILDSTGAEILGTKADAVWDGSASTPSALSLWKYIAAKVEAIRAAVTGVATAANQTTGLTTLSNLATANHTDLAAILTALGPAATATGQASIVTALGPLATAAGQASLLTALGPVSTAAAQASILAAINAALRAGENHIGEVGGNSAVVTATFNRPANTTAYAAGQLVANNTTAGSVTPMALAASRVADKTGLIRRGRLTKSGTSTANAVFRVHLYKTSPTPSAGDGGTFQTNNALAYTGSIDFDMTGANARSFTDGVKCIGTPNVGTEIIFDPATGTQNIFALIEARGAYTPVSGETFTLALEVMRD